MLREEFAGFVQAKGYRVLGSRVYGIYNGYPFHASFQGAGKGSVSFAFRVEGKIEKEAFKSARKALPKGYTLSMPQAGRYNLVCDGAKCKGAPADFPAALDTAVRTFREAGLTPPVLCPICKAGSCDSAAHVGSDYVPVHRACVESQARDKAEQAQQNQVSGNYVTGFIGAILGGIVGSLPNVFLLMWASRLYALLYALIPICAYYGYKLLRGKMNRGAFVCTLISSALNLFSIHFFTNYIALCQTLGRVISPAVGMRMYAELVQSGNLTANLVQSGIFLLLGLWFSWGIITRTSKHEVGQAVYTVDTMQPLSGVTEQAE